MSEPTREERPQHNEERIEAIQAAMADDEFLSVARVDDLRWLLKELAEAEQRRVDLVASLNEVGAFLMRVQAELAEARTEWKLLATDAYSFLGPRENATGDLDDDLRNILQGHMHCARIEKERDEASERATAAERASDRNSSQAEMATRGLESVAAKNKELRAEIERERGRYQWRPIAELHEDYGPCALINLHDPGGVQIGSNLEVDYDEAQWTHFSRIAPLTTEQAEDLIAAMGVAEEPTGGKSE